MALYVAICLLAALVAASHNHVEDNSNAVTLIWGTALGLALAHWFAFRVSSRLVARGSIRRADTVLALAQIGGAAAVAIVATVPAVTLGGSTGPAATRWVLAGVIAAVGYLVARRAGGSRLRSLAYASSMTAAAMVIVVIKNAAAGH